MPPFLAALASTTGIVWRDFALTVAVTSLEGAVLVGIALRCGPASMTLEAQRSPTPL